MPADLVGREEFRHAFRQLATTVGILTYLDLEGRPRGMTATSLCALSADPPSMLVCVDRTTGPTTRSSTRRASG